MSSRWDNHVETDDDIATGFERERSHRGQGHDRLHGDNPIPGVSSTIAMSGDNDDVEVAITAGQKMLSAMSGSLLTSLLGTREYLVLMNHSNYSSQSLLLMLCECGSSLNLHRNHLSRPFEILP